RIAEKGVAADIERFDLSRTSVRGGDERQPAAARLPDGVAHERGQRPAVDSAVVPRRLEAERMREAARRKRRVRQLPDQEIVHIVLRSKSAPARPATPWPTLARAL